MTATNPDEPDAMDAMFAEIGITTVERAIADGTLITICSDDDLESYCKMAAVRWSGAPSPVDGQTWEDFRRCWGLLVAQAFSLFGVEPVLGDDGREYCEWGHKGGERVPLTFDNLLESAGHTSPSLASATRNTSPFSSLSSSTLSLPWDEGLCRVEQPGATMNGVEGRGMATPGANKRRGATRKQRSAVERVVRYADGGHPPEAWPEDYQPVITSILFALEPNEHVQAGWRARSVGPREQPMAIGLVVVTDRRVLGADHSSDGGGFFAVPRTGVDKVELIGHRKTPQRDGDFFPEVRLLGPGGDVLGAPESPAAFQVFAKGEQPTAGDPHVRTRRDLESVVEQLEPVRAGRVRRPLSGSRGAKSPGGEGSRAKLLRSMAAWALGLGILALALFVVSHWISGRSEASTVDIMGEQPALKLVGAPGDEIHYGIRAETLEAKWASTGGITLELDGRTYVLVEPHGSTNWGSLGNKTEEVRKTARLVVPDVPEGRVLEGEIRGNLKYPTISSSVGKYRIVREDLHIPVTLEVVSHEEADRARAAHQGSWPQVGNAALLCAVVLGLASLALLVVSRRSRT